jgi:signal transduction histidine kinase
MTQPGAGQQETRWTAEVLRRASAVLHGRMVGVWEVSAENVLVPLAASADNGKALAFTPEVIEAVRRLAMPARPGSRWVAGQLVDKGHWAVAPVRDQVPAPPPNAQERRSRERLALELAGLCLGLSSQRVGAGEVEPPERDLYQRFTEQLGSFAQDIGGPLSAARAAVSRTSTLLGGGAQQEASREKVFEELRDAGRALEQAVSLVRTVQERARAVLSEGGHFDVVQVVWSCVDSERALAAPRGATLQLKTLAYVVSVPGNADDLRKVVTTAVRAAVDGLKGRPGTVRVSLENVGPVVRLTVRAPDAETIEAESAGMADARKTIDSTFGGTLSVSSVPGQGSTVTVALPVPSHRFRDPALWWER